MFARLDPNLLELSVGLWGESSALALEPRFLGVATTEEIVVRLYHGTLLAGGRAMKRRRPDIHEAERQLAAATV